MLLCSYAAIICILQGEKQRNGKNSEPVERSNVDGAPPFQRVVVDSKSQSYQWIPFNMYSCTLPTAFRSFKGLSLDIDGISIGRLATSMTA